jgi:lysophospholipase L1-like esterase
MPVISRGLPAFASSAQQPATDANDSDYSTYWRSTGPAWLAYDLSSVPAANRGQVVVGWYNDPITTPYDHTVTGDLAYNNLRAYTIGLNAAPGGGSPPTSGWVTVASVTNNTYHSRQHFLSMAGYNWIRINVTAIDGSSGNMDAVVNMDVHDASAAAQDSWIFYGDSITQDGMAHEPVSGAASPNFSQLVSAARPAYFPAAEDGGIGGLLSADGASHMNGWLSAFPGHYVGLAYGTNDANGCISPTTFYNNYVTMVQAVLNAGKAPIVPTIPWARTSEVQSCGPGLNAKIQQLYTNFPQVVRGPDLWTFFSTHQSLISGDDLHPSAAGYVAYRQQWANAMVANVYGP